MWDVDLCSFGLFQNQSNGYACNLSVKTSFTRDETVQSAFITEYTFFSFYMKTLFMISGVFSDFFFGGELNVLKFLWNT